jgi:hypothetical protein
MKKSIHVYEISLPEYSLGKKPNYGKVGAKIDSVIKKHFLRKWIAVRGISLQDHQGKSMNEMVAIIKKFGTDRYDPKRKSVHHEMDEKFNIDFHATPMIVKDKIYCGHYTEDRCPTGSVAAEIIRDFYEGAVVDRGYAVRLDILIIYDLDKLKAAPMKWQGEGPVYVEEPISPKETCCYQFKNPSKKKEALLGIIKIK